MTSDHRWQGGVDVGVNTPHPIFRTVDHGDVVQVEVRKHNRPVDRLPGDLHIEDVKAELRDRGHFGELTLMAVGSAGFLPGTAVPIAVAPERRPVMSSLAGSRFVRGATAEERERDAERDRERALDRERAELRRRADALLDEQRRTYEERAELREQSTREASDAVLRTTEGTVGHLRALSEMQIRQLEAQNAELRAELRTSQKRIDDLHREKQERIDDLRDRERSQVDAAVSMAEQRFAIERAQLQATVEDERRRVRDLEGKLAAAHDELQTLRMAALEARLTGAQPARSELQEELELMREAARIAKESGGDARGVLRAHGLIDDDDRDRDRDKDENPFSALLKYAPALMPLVQGGKAAAAGGGDSGGLGGLTVEEV